MSNRAAVMTALNESPSGRLASPRPCAAERELEADGLVPC